MSMRVAILDQTSRGEAKRPVVNVIVLEDISEVPAGFDGVASDEASPGDEWDGTIFSRPTKEG